MSPFDFSKEKVKKMKNLVDSIRNRGEYFYYKGKY
jgi:hypothetical protein